MTVASIGMVALGANVLQLRHLDQGWRVSLHRIVDYEVAEMEAKHALLCIQKGGDRCRSSTNLSFRAQAMRTGKE